MNLSVSSDTLSIMSDMQDCSFPDERLLSETLVQINVSRRNVSIYPRGHPAVERALNRAFGLLERLVAMKPELVLAIVKDGLIFDECAMEKRNTVYRELALTLSKMNIVSVTFLSGITKDELYEFQMLMAGNLKDPSLHVSLQEGLQKLSHIRAGFVDYRAFSFNEGKVEEQVHEGHLWERYVRGLLDGTLLTDELSGDEVAEAVAEVPPESLSSLLNNETAESVVGGPCERLVDAFMRKTPRNTFSLRELRRLIELINGLKPELKREFLSSAAKTLSGDIAATERTLTELSVDKVSEIFKLMNENDVAVPEQLANLFERLTTLHRVGIDDRSFKGRVIMDDIVLSPEIAGEIKPEGPPETDNDEVYQKQMSRLLLGDVQVFATEELKELKRECSDEHIEKDFNETVLEFLLPESSEEDYGYFVSLLKEQADQFLWTGQYDEVMKIIKVLETNMSENRFVGKTAESLGYYRSREFVSKFVDSLRTMGRQMREEAVFLCYYYGQNILPNLFQALIDEESATVRRFLLSLITNFGDRAIPEAAKRLDDSRWFVTRNMIFVISECGSAGVGDYVRPYCNHENLKVSFEAVKCLLKTGDGYGITAVRDHLGAEDGERREQAIALSGSFRIREVVPDLVSLLKVREVSGADYFAKIPVVRALGHIGDPAVLAVFREILAAKRFLFKGAAEKLKEEIYSTLRNYAPEEITDFVESGLKSKNEQIRKVALRLKAR